MEFGAWDGLHLNNSRHLIESQGYSAVFVEPNPKRFADLKRNYAHHAQPIICFNKFVNFSGQDTLDDILSSTPIPRDFDLLSIDIDGNDYHVWKAVEKYRPKVVIIEYNPTIPIGVKFVQPANGSVSQGASAASLIELAREKGYELVSCLVFNCFFVRKDLFGHFKISQNDEHIMRTDLEYVTHMFTGFDGHVFLRGSLRLPWQRMQFNEKKMQRLPAFMQTFPPNFNWFQRLMYYPYLLISEPKRMLKKAWERFRQP